MAEAGATGQWTAADAERLRDLLSAGVPLPRCAEALGRTYFSTWKKARRLAPRKRVGAGLRPKLALAEAPRRCPGWRTCVVSRAEFERLGGTGIPEMLKKWRSQNLRF